MLVIQIVALAVLRFCLNTKYADVSIPYFSKIEGIKMGCLDISLGITVLIIIPFKHAIV